MIELDILRMTLLVGVSIAIILNYKSKLATGGLLTGAYLSLILLSGNVANIFGWLALTALSVVAIRISTRFFAIPKSWVLSISICTSAIVHGVLVLISVSQTNAPIALLTGLEVALAAGMYLTPGLTAYDLVRQGWLKTLATTFSVAVLTTAVAHVTIWFINTYSTETFSFSNIDYVHPKSDIYTDWSFPIVMVICILIAETLRVNFHWGTGGIIGAVFFVEILTWSSLVTMIILTAVTVILAKIAQKMLILTPKGWFQFTLLLGMAVAWAGLCLGNFLGIDAAIGPNTYALEPLLAVGLISADVNRFGLVKTVAGKIFTLTAISLVGVMLLQADLVAIGAIGTIILLTISIALIGWIKISQGWDHARKVGRLYPISAFPENVQPRKDVKAHK